MTLVIALRWVEKGNDSILISSDSKASGYVAYEVKKIYPIYYSKGKKEVYLGIAGGSGDPSQIKKGYEIIEEILKKHSENLENQPLDFDEFRKAVREIERELVNYSNFLKESKIEPEFDIVLGSVDKNGKSSLYRFDWRGLAEPVHDSPGFAIIGKGSITGGMLLTKLLGYSPENSPKMDLGLLSAFIIDMVSEIDPSVGPFVGESYLMRLEKGIPVIGPLKSHALKQYKKKVRLRKLLIQYLQEVCDRVGEEKVLKMLKSL